MNRKELKELHCGNIDIRFYGDHKGANDHMSVTVCQSVPQKHNETTYYQTINHNFQIDSIEELAEELKTRLTSFAEAVK